MRNLTMNECLIIDGGFGTGGLKNAAHTALESALISSFLVAPGIFAVLGYELYTGAAVGGAILKAVATTIFGVSASVGVVFGLKNISYFD